MTIVNITWYKNTIIVPKDTIISQNRRSWRLHEKGVLPNHDWHKPIDGKPWNEVSNPKNHSAISLYNLRI